MAPLFKQNLITHTQGLSYLYPNIKVIYVQYRDANFQDAEIVRSEERRGLEPRAGPSRVREQRHFGGPREICHCISDIQKILQKNKLKPCLIKITGCYLVFTLEKYELYLLLINTWSTKVKGLEIKYMMNKSTQRFLL